MIDKKELENIARKHGVQCPCTLLPDEIAELHRTFLAEHTLERIAAFIRHPGREEIYGLAQLNSDFSKYREAIMAGRVYSSRFPEFYSDLSAAEKMLDEYRKRTERGNKRKPCYTFCRPEENEAVQPDDDVPAHDLRVILHNPPRLPIRRQ